MISRRRLGQKGSESDKRYFWIPIALIVVFAVSAIIRSWYNPSGAHGQRQLDTAGMSLALFLDFKHEGLKAFWTTLWFPRVLQRGLSSGINVSEFPLLNLITAPLFSFGPHLGNCLTSLFIFLLNLYVSVFYVQILFNKFNIKLSKIICALIYFSINSIGFQASIVMPEGLSFPLLVIGAAEYCEFFSQLNLRRWIGWILLSLAVAVKPTAVVGYLALAVYPFFLFPKGALGQSWKSKNCFRYYIGLAMTLAFPAWWYTLHSYEILKHIDGHQVFALAKFQPFLNLREVGGKGILQLIWRQLNTEHFPFYMGVFWIPLAVYFEPFLFVTLLFAILAAISLDGPHIFVHAYYFYGVGLVALLLIGRVVSVAKTPLLKFLCFFSICWGVLYSIRGNIWVIARTYNWWEFSAPLRAALVGKNDVAIISDDEVDPTKFFFLGTVGTIGKDFTGQICHLPDYKTKRLVFIVTESTLKKSNGNSDNCLSNAVSIATAKSDFASWDLLFWSPIDR